MQIEKHIKIVPTPTGAVVFFAGQVCLSVNEHSGRFTWSISPVFARLTTGITNCFQVPMASWDGQETLAEAIADGLTRLDEMQAFYGVIDIPEDTYVGEHLDEGTDYSGIHGDVKRTGKTHEQLAAEHRAYAKQMRAIGKDGLAVRSEMLANSHDKYIASQKKTNESVDESVGSYGVSDRQGYNVHSGTLESANYYVKKNPGKGLKVVKHKTLGQAPGKDLDEPETSKKTYESVEDLLAESFVVRQVGKSRNHSSRVMISADAVIKRAREMAKEAGDKTHGKFIKLAHSEIASMMKTESEEIEGEQIEEGFNDTDTVFLTPQTGPIAHMRYNTFKEGSTADHKKAIKYHTKEADRATPQKAAFHDMRAKMHKDHLSGKNEEFDQIEEGSVSKEKQETPYRNINSPEYKAAAEKQRQKIVNDKMTEPGRKLLSKLKNEEFVQYEYALPEVFQLIKEDCRAEALTMTDSLVEAQQLANELFEDIVEEYLNELSKGTLKSYIDKARGNFSNQATNIDDDDFYDDRGHKMTDIYGRPKFKKRSADTIQKSHNDIQKRLSGMTKAYRKVATEEVEEIDELSKDTLASYKGQAITTMSKRIDAIGHPTEPKSVSKMAKVPKIPGLFWDKKRSPTDIKYRARDAERDRIAQGIDRATRKLSEDLDEEYLDEAQRYAKETGKKYSDQTGQYIGGKNYDKLAAKQGIADLLKKKSIKTEEVEELDEAATSIKDMLKQHKLVVDTYKDEVSKPNPDHMTLSRLQDGHSYWMDKLRRAKKEFPNHPALSHIKEEVDEASSDFGTSSSEKTRQKAETDKIKKELQARAERDEKNMKNYQSGNVRANFKESVDEAALSGDAYWKAKEAESKEEFLKAQRKALGLPEPVKRGRGKPTLIDRDLLKTRAHSNVEAGKRPTAGFDRNEKIHFVRHLKNHPDFADKHVSQAGRPTGTTKVAKEQKDLAKKKQDSAFSMWAGLGKR